jgi:hypothetical protein
MEMEFGKEDQGIAISIKDNIKTTKSKAMEFSLGQMEMYIKEII